MTHNNLQNWATKHQKIHPLQTKLCYKIWVELICICLNDSQLHVYMSLHQWYSSSGQMQNPDESSSLSFTTRPMAVQVTCATPQSDFLVLHLDLKSWLAAHRGLSLHHRPVVWSKYPAERRRVRSERASATFERIFCISSSYRDMAQHEFGLKSFWTSWELSKSCWGFVSLHLWRTLPTLHKRWEVLLVPNCSMSNLSSHMTRIPASIFRWNHPTSSLWFVRCLSSPCLSLHTPSSRVVAWPHLRGMIVKIQNLILGSIQSDPIIVSICFNKVQDERKQNSDVTVLEYLSFWSFTSSTFKPSGFHQVCWEQCGRQVSRQRTFSSTNLRLGCGA